MNGGADLGGMMGFGPVVEEENEPNFHARWEERVLGITIALGACGIWNIDQGRFARESMQPADYMTSSYYEIWLYGITKLLKAHGMIIEEELASGTASLAPVPINKKLLPDDVMATLLAGHTRLPRYARDKVGVITKVYGVHVFPDSSGQGLGESPTWLYQVSFTADTLWGEDKNKRDTVSLDLWQPYLKATT